MYGWAIMHLLILEKSVQSEIRYSQGIFSLGILSMFFLRSHTSQNGRHMESYLSEGSIWVRNTSTGLVSFQYFRDQPLKTEHWELSAEQWHL